MAWKESSHLPQNHPSLQVCWNWTWALTDVGFVIVLERNPRTQMNLQAGYKENTISQSNGFCKIRACVWGWSCFDRPAHESIHTGQEFNHTAARFLHGPLVLCFQAACKGVAIGWWWAGLQGDSSSFSYKISRSKIWWEGFYCLNLHQGTWIFGHQILWNAPKIPFE